jgi:hypothetical protein
MHDALALQEAGASLLVLEAIPTDLAEANYSSAKHSNYRNRSWCGLLRTSFSHARYAGCVSRA